VSYFLLYILRDFFQTNYLNIHRTDFYEICRIGGTLAVGERSEVIFFRFLENVATTNNYLSRQISETLKQQFAKLATALLSVL